MKQAFKKVLAIVLTVAMIQGTGGFFSFADTTDAARDAESAQPGVTVEEREVKAEDPGTEESGAQEEKAEEPQEASGQSGDEDGQAEEAVTDQKEQEVNLVLQQREEQTKKALPLALSALDTLRQRLDSFLSASRKPSS